MYVVDVCLFIHICKVIHNIECGQISHGQDEHKTSNRKVMCYPGCNLNGYMATQKRGGKGHIVK